MVYIIEIIGIRRWTEDIFLQVFKKIFFWINRNEKFVVKKEVYGIVVRQYVKGLLRITGTAKIIDFLMVLWMISS